MRRFHGSQLSWHLKLPHIYEDVIDASLNTCFKLKDVFWEKRLYFSGRQYFEMESLYQTESCLTSCIFLWCMSQTSRDRADSRHVRTHKNNSGDAIRGLGTIIQSIFCAQPEASIRLTVWKWSGESQYPGAFPNVLKTFVAPLLQARLIAPGSPSRDGFERHHQSLFRYDVCLLSLLKVLLLSK